MVNAMMTRHRRLPACPALNPGQRSTPAALHTADSVSPTHPPKTSTPRKKPGKNSEAQTLWVPPTCTRHARSAYTTLHYTAHHHPCHRSGTHHPVIASLTSTWPVACQTSTLLAYGLHRHATRMQRKSAIVILIVVVIYIFAD